VRASTPQRGTLYLVVGPSGAGKDSLIDGANAALGRDRRYVFPRRYITRSAEAGGEDHIPLSESMFEEMLGRGDMLLEWRAHNLRYGVPIVVNEYLTRGRNVVLNVSRTVVDDARTNFAPVRVLYVTVSDDVLAQRLRGRGRETERDIERRVARAREYELTGEDVVHIDNGGQLEASVSVFVAAIGAEQDASKNSVSSPEMARSPHPGAPT